jgi:hypothetical protein
VTHPGESVAVGRMSPEAIGPIFASAKCEDTWQTDEGEFVWLFDNGLALRLVLLWQPPCPTCGRRDADPLWELTLGSQLARTLHRRGYAR